MIPVPKAQDDLARQRRLNAGCCPTHGTYLWIADTTSEGLPVVACALDECEFITVARAGSKLHQAVVRKLSCRYEKHF